MESILGALLWVWGGGGRAHCPAGCLLPLAQLGEAWSWDRVEAYG